MSLLERFKNKDQAVINELLTQKIVNGNMEFASAIAQKGEIVDFKPGTYVAVKFSADTLLRLQNLQKRTKLNNPLPLEELHATICYSRNPIHVVPKVGNKVIAVHGFVENLATGDGNAVVLRLYSPYLVERHNQLKKLGATHDFPDYLPHISLSYDDKITEEFRLDVLIEMTHEYVEELTDFT